MGPRQEVPLVRIGEHQEPSQNAPPYRYGPAVEARQPLENQHLVRRRNNYKQREALPGFENFLSHASWKENSKQPLMTWSIDHKLKLYIGEGSGQLSSPYSIGSQEFTSLCQTLQFSPRFLNKLAAKASTFEHRFVFREEHIPTHLEIAMSIYEIDGFYCLLRYDLKDRSVNCMLFLKTMDYIKDKPLQISTVVAWLEKNHDILQQYPLLVLNVILELIQFRAQEFVRWRLILNNLESRLGVTKDGKTLISIGYEEMDLDFTLLSADIAGASKKVADTELSASTIVEHARSLQRIMSICETCDKSWALEISEQHEEIQSTIVRGELFLKHLKMTHDVLQNLTAVLFNRINKQDTDSMKTIAVVTLVFLPATFVSAVFSTGIFNFHAGEEAGHERTISKYGWVYLLACLLSTSLTLGFWICWYRWGRLWLEHLKFSRIQYSGKLKPVTGNITARDVSFRGW